MVGRREDVRDRQQLGTKRSGRFSRRDRIRDHDTFIQGTGLPGEGPPDPAEPDDAEREFRHPPDAAPYGPDAGRITLPHPLVDGVVRPTTRRSIVRSSASA